MDNLPDASPLTPISSMLAGIHPDEFDDPQFSDCSIRTISDSVAPKINPCSTHDFRHRIYLYLLQRALRAIFNFI